MSVEAALEVFFAESRELLGAMEAALLDLGQGGDAAEAVDAVFRAAHTIKGSAGMFELDALVAFTHEVEALLVEARAGRVSLDAPLVGLLLECGDHIGALLAAAGDGAPPPDAGELAARLAAKRPNPDRAPATPLASARAAEGEAVRESAGGPAAGSDHWHISVRFGRDVLRDGMDPLSVIRYLRTFGRIVSVNALFDAMPQDPADMDAESCYAGLEIDFDTEADRERVEGAFEFVRDASVVRILPPHSLVDDYMRLIRELPEDPARLGDLLVKSGALTRAELDRGLAMQHARRDGPAPVEGTRLGEILLGQGSVPGEVIGAALEKQRLAREHEQSRGNHMRVRSDKLDELITLVGELVIASAGATQAAAAARAGTALVEANQSVERLTEAIRDRALRLRMVPIGETFGRYRRVVHDLSAELGKEVDLEVHGGETELDKSMVERIADPLTHLVRNALDHGIEAPGVRAEHGKPRRGRLRLHAYHDAGSVVIEVSDDGAGLDRARIRACAIQRGLLQPDQAVGDAELLQFILAPGFSTAREVTSVSGRGVGMDVVRRNIEALRGTVAVDSADGAGTTIRLRLPLTLAIIDGFQVGVAGSVYVIPLELLAECLDPPGGERTAARAGGYIELRGEVLPLLRLRDVFELRAAAPRQEKIAVVRFGGQRAGLVVDALLGEVQAVIKPLGKLFGRLSGIGGSTILGSGEVALVLDVQKLIERAAASERARR